MSNSNTPTFATETQLSSITPIHRYRYRGASSVTASYIVGKVRKTLGSQYREDIDMMDDDDVDDPDENDDTSDIITTSGTKCGNRQAAAAETRLDTSNNNVDVDDHDDGEIQGRKQLDQRERVEQHQAPYGGKRLLFTSPRLLFEDDNMFFAPQSPSYQDAAMRWERISSQAAEHRQDGSRLTIRAKVSPVVLKNGLTNEARRRVEHIFLCVDEDTLVPTWLDEFSIEDFPNLKHLNFIECDFPGEDKMAASARMRRLYVLYRLPHLLSIDGQDVTNDERRLARPNDPLLSPNTTQEIEASDDEDNKTISNSTDEKDDENIDDGILPTSSSDDGIPAPADEAGTKATNLDISTKTNDDLDHDMSHLELASVASTDIEWSAACGVLLFRSDRTCAPRLRLPFSKGTRKILAPEDNIRNKIVQKIATPQTGCCSVLLTQKRISASESLSSPFPREFRERHIIARSKANTQSQSSLSARSLRKQNQGSSAGSDNVASMNPGPGRSDSSKSTSGLPPPCPNNGGQHRAVPPMTRRQQNKLKRRISQRQSCRSNSVMDIDSDDDEED